MGSSLEMPWMPEVALKPGWARVAFGDVVKLSGERSSEPEQDGFERYVGLDHLDPGDLKIRRWGDVAGGTTFTSVFRPGHVLFGKRRAYQHKVAIADFSGVCSGDIYVFEPKSSQLLSELLPYICQTARFFEHAIGTSAGSLSPRTNWNSLASYEFALPPLEEQRRFSAAFHAVDATLESLNNVVAKAWKRTRSASGQVFADEYLFDRCRRCARKSRTVRISRRRHRLVRIATSHPRISATVTSISPRRGGYPKRSTMASIRGPTSNSVMCSLLKMVQTQAMLQSIASRSLSAFCLVWPSSDLIQRCCCRGTSLSIFALPMAGPEFSVM